VEDCHFDLKNSTTTTMFIGEFHLTIDDKGRLAVPVKFRSALATGAVVTRGLDTSLFVLTQEAWQRLSAKIADLPLGSAASRSFARFMLAGAMDVTLDAQGRFVVPEYLRTYAKLHKDAVLVGVNDRLELWDKVTWDAYAREAEQNAEAVAESLGGLGI
jgi:MraZ protein